MAHHMKTAKSDETACARKPSRVNAPTKKWSGNSSSITLISANGAGISRRAIRKTKPAVRAAHAASSG